MLTVTHLGIIMECPTQRAKQWAPHLNATMERFNITTPARAAAFLAQVGHESGRLQYVREIWNPKQVPEQAHYSQRAGLGNTKLEAIVIATNHASNTGEWWKGRGLIQITGYNNYLFCGTALGLDLLNHPELLEIPEHAAACAGWFWVEGAGLNLGLRALSALKKYQLGAGVDLNVLADKGDFEAITYCINGGMNGWVDRLAIFERAKTVLNEEQPA
jgi:putative chitinase